MVQVHHLRKEAKRLSENIWCSKSHKVIAVTTKNGAKK